MTRAIAANYAAGQYVLLRSQLGIDGTDTAGGVGPALDQAFLAMGVPYEELPDAETDAALDQLLLALIRYYILDLCREAVALKVDLTLSDDGIAKRYGQQAEHLAKMQQAVLADVERLRGELEAAGLLGSAGEYGCIFVGALENTPDGVFA